MREVPPAAPPLSMFPIKNLNFSVLGSLNDKLNELATVGAKIFLVCILEGEVQCLGGEISKDVGKVTSPKVDWALWKWLIIWFITSSLQTLTKQSTIPLYFLAAPLSIFLLASWVYNNSLTLSMGATAVLETAALTPPIKKSLRKSELISFRTKNYLNLLFDFYF